MGTACGGRCGGWADGDRAVRDGGAGARHRYAANDQLRQPAGAQLGDVRPERGVRRPHHEQRSRGPQERHVPQPDPDDGRQRTAAAGRVPELELRWSGHGDRVRLQCRDEARHESDRDRHDLVEDALGRLLSGLPDRGELHADQRQLGHESPFLPHGAGRDRAPVGQRPVAGSDVRPVHVHRSVRAHARDGSERELEQPAGDERVRAEPAAERRSRHVDRRRSRGRSPTRVPPPRPRRSASRRRSPRATRRRSSSRRSRRSRSSSTTRRSRIRSTTSTTTASSSRRASVTTHTSSTSRISRTRASRPSSSSRRRTEGGTSARRRRANHGPLRRPASVRRRRP